MDKQTMLDVLRVYERMLDRATVIRDLADRCAGDYADSDDFAALEQCDAAQDADAASAWELNQKLGR